MWHTGTTSRGGEAAASPGVPRAPARPGGGAREAPGGPGGRGEFRMTIHSLTTLCPKSNPPLFWGVNLDEVPFELY